ncbi:5473_t:CDS:1 [Gigaspora margarita]|uniref:5473_t:CDS:1 n=1 Tax=Gigaspora margarita TaxID=4874 RepID=A0ABN7UIM6_GIGMA|nr:5473_t:CDS:1 [Gigaspora margarita]
MGRRAKMVPISKTIDIPPEERISSNRTEFFADDVNNFGAIGRLNFKKASDGTTDYCTATVIKTDNGNMALTAAHCLWDIETEKWNSEFYFYPGYNNGQGFGSVRAYTFTIWKDFTIYETLYDYGFIKFYYDDGSKLQDDVGAFDVEFDLPGGDFPVTVFGYPVSGEMPNCPNDGEHICSWQGNSFDFVDSNLPNHEWHRGIPIDVGAGSSGGSWIRDYDPNANTGVIDGISHGLLPPPYPSQDTTTWKWQNDDFSELFKAAEDFNP